MPKSADGVHFSLDGEKLKTLLPFVRDTDKEVYKNLYFEQQGGHGVIMVATDGASLLVRFDPDGHVLTPDGRPLVLSSCGPNERGKKGILHAILETCRTIKTPYRLEGHNGRAFVNGASNQEQSLAVLLDPKRQFPDWKRLVKGYASAAPFSDIEFNPELLRRFSWAYKSRANLKLQTGVRLWKDKEARVGTLDYYTIFVTSTHPNASDMLGALAAQSRDISGTDVLNLDDGKVWFKRLCGRVGSAS